jgi:hypothetical protein
LAGAKGAYVNALALASTREQYQTAVSAALTELALFAFEFDDVEPFQERLERVTLEPSICQLADDTLRSGQVRFDDFHTFKIVDG